MVDDAVDLEAIWLGDAAPDALRRALATGRVRLTAPAIATSGAGPAVLVHASTLQRAFKLAGDRTWIWLCPRPVPLAIAQQAVARGAYDVLALSAAGAADRVQARLAELAAPELAVPATPRLVGASAAAKAMLARLAHAARTSMPVLITGETGTGKEEAAALIHNWSARRAGRYMPVNCAAIPNELMESELFGHARGAFSGAVGSLDGRLIAADGGTVFLDEIDDTPLSTQVKLLRVLEDGEVTRLGEALGRKVDFRIVAATNRDLGALIAAGAFGRDFYERLAIVRIELPPLRDRRDDIAALVEHFMLAYFERERLPRRVQALSELALEALRAHSWPGNIRELRNVVFSSLVNKRAGDTLLLSDLPPLSAGTAGQRGEGSLFDDGALRARIRGRAFNLRAELDALERSALRLALQEGRESPTAAARLLGEVGRGRARDPSGTVRAMMRRHGFS